MLLDLGSEKKWTFGRGEEGGRKGVSDGRTKGGGAPPPAGTVGAARGLQAREGRSKRPERRHTLVFSLPWPKSSRVFSRPEDGLEEADFGYLMANTWGRRDKKPYETGPFTDAPG